jgi:hypothetical protein
MMLINISNYFIQILFPYLYNNEINCLVITSIIPIIDMLIIQEPNNENQPD